MSILRLSRTASPATVASASNCTPAVPTATAANSKRASVDSPLPSWKVRVLVSCPVVSRGAGPTVAFADALPGATSFAVMVTVAGAVGTVTTTPASKVSLTRTKRGTLGTSDNWRRTTTRDSELPYLAEEPEAAKALRWWVLGVFQCSQGA